jgi:hypothetical protein
MLEHTQQLCAFIAVLTTSVLQANAHWQNQVIACTSQTVVATDQPHCLAFLAFGVRSKRLFFEACAGAIGCATPFCSTTKLSRAANHASSTRAHAQPASVCNAKAIPLTCLQREHHGFTEFIVLISKISVH